MKPCQERSGENNRYHHQQTGPKHNREPAMSQNNQAGCKLNYETKSGLDIGVNHQREQDPNDQHTNGSSLHPVTNYLSHSEASGKVDRAVAITNNEPTPRHNSEPGCIGSHSESSQQCSEVCSKRHHSGDSLGSSQKPSPKRKTVMIAMDGSGHSFYAFDWYMSQMHTPDTEVIVAHSSLHHSKPFSHVQNLMPSVITSDPSSMSRIIQQEEEEVNKIVTQIKGKLTQAGVSK
ncbi:hypothetical protein Btru_067355 [Bulinus truncatus]|nr:hypothetical protein Btru_067355 [Bulinus truncatus]